MSLKRFLKLYFLLGALHSFDLGAITVSTTDILVSSSNDYMGNAILESGAAILKGFI